MVLVAAVVGGDGAGAGGTPSELPHVLVVEVDVHHAGGPRHRDLCPRVELEVNTRLPAHASTYGGKIKCEI